ncbi:S1 RNA-binding domain-containing protein [Mollicutes bacterium LVI A0039]|nr:S1 RNA-binding domain-containing protein [Mollicutes bacterium LVI A0039]
MLDEHLNNKISRLKVDVIKSNGLIVQQINGESGFVHISEISHNYIDNLENYFKVGDTIYGVKIKTHYGKNYYSLKVGHTMSRSIQKRFKITETGGGYLGIIYQQNIKLNSQKRRK